MVHVQIGKAGISAGKGHLAEAIAALSEGSASAACML